MMEADGTKVRWWRGALTVAMLWWLAGCMGQQPQKAPVEKVLYEKPEPVWFTRPPEDDEKRLYETGDGNDTASALNDTKDRLRERLCGIVETYARRRASEEGGLSGFIDSKTVQEACRSVEKAAPEPEVMEKRRLSKERTVLLASFDRHALAAPLKSATLRRLVAIEERWHAAMKEPPPRRAELARASLDGMRRLLPLYLAADAIEPFGEAVRKRVETGLPYFRRMARTLPKRVRYCVEPVRVPSLKLFAKALREALSEKKLLVEPRHAPSGALCVKVTGRLEHARAGGRHIVDADIALGLHERYKPIRTIRRFHVRGESEESGSIALERAAEAFGARVVRALGKGAL
ncbi:hypothetical protein [Hydrogenimonas sp.]